MQFLMRKHLKRCSLVKKPDISHFQIFGCPVYIHIPKEKRTKMEPSGKKGTFFGYNETSKSSKIYVPSERHVEVTRNVTFLEDEEFKWSKEIKYDLEIEDTEFPTLEYNENESSSSDIQR